MGKYKKEARAAKQELRFEQVHTRLLMARLRIVLLGFTCTTSLLLVLLAPIHSLLLLLLAYFLRY